MLQSPIRPADPESWLRSSDAEMPVHFFAPDALQARLSAFHHGFPGMVTYAVKANPSRSVIAKLCAGGIKGFDVASPQEIALIRKLCPHAHLHYNNPVRSAAEIKAGIEGGVVSWSVDDPTELEKLIAAGATGEIAVRFKLPVEGAHYNFGAKFGAEEAQAVALLSRVAAAGLTPALTFHVGTQCADPNAYTTYMQKAAEIARSADVQIARLNVGGGFPSSRDGKALDLEPYFAAIRAGLSAFETAPELVCEPGRGLVADAFSYAVRVKSLRDGRAYLNDGIYGGLSEFPSMVIPVFRVISREGHTPSADLMPRVVFGPTCDSLDQLPHALELPSDIKEGDWILFQSMGAYLTGVTTRFNGYGARETVEVDQL